MEVIYNIFKVSVIILTYLIVISGFIFIFYMIYQNNKVKQMRRYLKIGDNVDYYVGEERITAKVINITSENNVEISYIYNGNYVTIVTSLYDLYPNIMEKYN